MSSQTREVHALGQRLTIKQLVDAFKSIYQMNIPQLADKLDVEGVDKATLRACAFAGGTIDVRIARKLELSVERITQGVKLPPLSKR